MAGTKNGNDPPSASWLNSLRISTCCNRLSMHVDMAPRIDHVEAIDFSVSSNEIPPRAPELPLLLKKVCRLKDETFLPAAILVLMISIKNACQRKWFSDQDSEELRRLTNELQSRFCTTMGFTTQPKSFYTSISTIMSRYHPRIKMGDLIAFLEVKPGYGTYVHDFQITNNLKSSKEERIRLFVAQTDNMNTSSCLISPTDVRRGVDRRRTNFMDTGPRMPTLVNHYLKYGTNLLQAVGQFNGNYIMVISFMRMVSCPDHATLPDYVQPTLSTVDPDPEIIEGPSRISLSCPISFTQIKVPVKGRMCKHLQCIDYKNFVAMNVRRPSWRCPHCNQHVCFTDIRVDQNMVKVLKEVGKTVNVITISSDGSWKPVAEIDDHCSKQQEKDTEVSTESVALESSDICPDEIMDLTEDTYMDTMELCDTADKKRFSSSCQNQANKQDIAVDSNIINANEPHQNSTVQVEDSFWRGIYFSPDESGLPNCDSKPQISALRNGHVENTFMSRHASGTTVSVQALPVPSSTTASLQQKQRDHHVINNNSLVVPRTSAVSPTGESAPTVPDIIEGQQNFTRTNLNPLQKSLEPSSKVQQHPVSQTVSQQAPLCVKRSFNVAPLVPSPKYNYSQQQTPNTVKSSYKVTPVFPSGNHNSNQQPPNMSENMNQSSRPQTYQGGSSDGIVSNKRARELVALHQAASTTRVGLASKTPSPYAMNYDRQGASLEGLRSHVPPSPSQRPTEAVVPMGMDTGSNRQPSVGRMRGSLTGRAYLDAYNHYISRPPEQPQTTTQPGQATIHSDRAKSHPATQQPPQAIHPDRSPKHTATQQAKAAIQPTKAAKHFHGAVTLPALATTQQAQATTHLHGAIKQPALTKSQEAQRHPVTATTQKDQITPHQSKVITEQDKATTEPAKAITDEVRATIQQAKSTSSVSIANLLSRSASSRLKVLAANRAALAQAGIYPNSGSGSSSAVLFGKNPGKN